MFERDEPTGLDFITICGITDTVLALHWKAIVDSTSLSEKPLPWAHSQLWQSCDMLKKQREAKLRQVDVRWSRIRLQRDQS